MPANAVSGVYFANLDRLDQPGVSNRIFFVVRNDGRAADIMLQTSDTTMHAYNRYGGNSLYYSEHGLGRAYKVSYNRPFRIDGNGNAFWDAEYPLVRWLERNGYDVTYCTGVDTHRLPGQLANKKLFVSSGHDEYWSAEQRATVESARDSGVNLAFMSGNEVFWKVRWENSIDPSATPMRTMVCYKETLAGAKIDPSPSWTGTWRDPRFSPPADGGRPELPLIGQIFGAINDETQPDLTVKVPSAYGGLRFWRSTDLATLPPGQTVSLTQGTLGYEWDDDRDVGPKPPGLVELTSTTETVPAVLTDHGGSYASRPATHRVTLYRAPSGALVFGTGTIQWSWGLDATHPRQGGSAQARMQQATANMLADLGALPATLQSGLVMPTASTDHTAPTSTITSPANGASLPVGSPVTVSGTAADVGRQGRHRRGVDRRRRHLEAGRGHHLVELRLHPHRARAAHHPVAGHRRQREHRDPRTRHHDHRRRAGLPRLDLALLDHPHGPLQRRRQPHRGGPQVPGRRRRLRHRRPLLQGRRQHRHPHRPSVGRLRRQAGRGHLRRRDGVRLAAGHVPDPGGDQQEHHLRHLLLRSGRQLRRRHRLPRHRLRRLAPPGPGRRRGRPQRPVPLRLHRLPRHVVQREQLLGRRRLRHRRPAGPDGHRPQPGPRPRRRRPRRHPRAHGSARR